MPRCGCSVLTMEWVTGVKLTTLAPDEIRKLSKIGSEAFLTQLLDIGFMHGDPHPGNLLKVTEGPNAGKLVLLDFGLVAEIPSADREAMVSAVIHLANRVRGRCMHAKAADTTVCLGSRMQASCSSCGAEALCGRCAHGSGARCAHSQWPHGAHAHAPNPAYILQRLTRAHDRISTGTPAGLGRADHGLLAPRLSAGRCRPGGHHPSHGPRADAVPARRRREVLQLPGPLA